MSQEKVFKLSNKFEIKLKKIATNSPNERSVHQVISNYFDSVKSNPALKGCIGISAATNLTGAIGEDLLVYFQVIADPRWYNTLIEEPYRSGIINFLKPGVEQILRNTFSGYDFNVKVGITVK
jgi:hypothetical protein